MQNVVLWHSDIRVSWKTQYISLLLHGALVLLVLLSPWNDEYWVIWLTLVTLVIFDCLRSQRYIQRMQGEMMLLNNGVIQWQRDEWQIKGRPMILRFAVLLKLTSITNKNRRRRLWIAIDSMDTESWRALRFQLLQIEKSENKR
ncbi:MAG: protein YgfX [Enterobacteriaceae bacterium]|jgi:toxin CptA|nr:protein YgfX [Enterobacteriaceae bacterium]